MRIAFTDGEMANLNADFGQLLCACVLEYAPRNPAGGRLQTFQLTDFRGRRWDDKSLAKVWRDELERFDIVVSWNGIKFDVPFLNSRLEWWKLRAVKLAHHVDLMYTARFKLKLSSASLDSVARFLGCKAHKTPMRPDQWTKAMGGHQASYDYILRHCRNDVRVLAEVWERVKHLVREIK